MVATALQAAGLSGYASADPLILGILVVAVAGLAVTYLVTRLRRRPRRKSSGQAR